MKLKTDERTIIASTKTPYGANYDKNTEKLEFTLRSPDATDVLLCLFDQPIGVDPFKAINMAQEDGVWKASISIAKKAISDSPVYYGYRVFGPNWQNAPDYKPGVNPGSGFMTRFDIKTGFRFNPNKLAIDPYAQWSHNPDRVHDQRVFRGSKEMFMEDTAQVAPKSVFRLYDDIEMPKVPTKRSLCEENYIAEVHIKDLTILVGDTYKKFKSKKGTYAAAAEFAPELKKMGVSMVEFLPLNEFNTDSELGSELKNYWGYMPLTYFGLSNIYTETGDALGEFREMVKTFHENDIKVCMDVVYNHDGEAGHCNSTEINDVKYFSHTPIADTHYHRLLPDGNYRDNTGCGGDFNTVSQLGQELIADALAFFANLGVDAFRLDLASALMDVSKGREEIKYEPFNPDCLAKKLTKMLEERGVKVDSPSENSDGINLIAEPWNCTQRPDGTQYQAGRFPDNWAEWSDITREFIKREAFQPYYIAPVDLIEYYDGFVRTYGQSGEGEGKKMPINYVSSHDEYTMFDINTPAHQTGSHQEREALIKKQIAMLFLSRGIPMLQLGDVIGHSKRNRHNTYNQDNDLNYLDYPKALDEDFRPIDTEQGRIYEFTKAMADFRADNPVLSKRKAGEDIEYYNQGGAKSIHDNPQNLWDKSIDFFGAMFLGEKRIYAASTKSDTPTNFSLPENSDNKKWYKVCDSADRYFKFNTEGNDEPEAKEDVLSSKSICIFIER